jgi:predicted transcriptional regulator
MKRSNEDLKLIKAKSVLSDPHKHRSRLSIIADILDIAKRGTIKTRIMYGARLSFTQLNEYFSFLLDVNLLEAVETAKKTIYKTTTKGLQYLQCYMEIRELLEKEEENIP